MVCIARIVVNGRRGIRVPFRSKRQRSWMQLNNPKLYRKWKRRYGVKVRRGVNE